MIANQPDDPAAGAPTRKLFFALWPDEQERAALAALQAQVTGRLTPPAKLHMTLAFLGHLSAASVPALLEIRAALAVPPLTLVFDCYGYFARPRIAWAGMTRVPDELVALHEDLVRRLGQAGFSAATHGAFKPHVTLAREAKQARRACRAGSVGYPRGGAGRIAGGWDVPGGRQLASSWHY